MAHLTVVFFGAPQTAPKRARESMEVVTPNECGPNRGGLDQQLLEDDERSAFGGRGTPVLNIPEGYI